VRRWRWRCNLYSTAKDRIYHPLSAAVVSTDDTPPAWPCRAGGPPLYGRAVRPRDWCNRGVTSQRGARKSVPQTITRDDGDDRDLHPYNGIICWNVSNSRAVLAGRFRHQLGPFLYILWAVLVDTGRFGPWSGPFRSFSSFLVTARWFLWSSGSLPQRYTLLLLFLWQNKLSVRAGDLFSLLATCFPLFQSKPMHRPIAVVCISVSSSAEIR